jgi:FHS family L-fucose permease-like MFS transporter
MWGCIFTLSTNGLKEYTSKASGIFMMGVFGGAVFPVLQGVMSDFMGSWRWTWFIVVVCELIILYYALYGSRLKDVESLELETV